MGICSWDFELRGEGRVARLGFGWPTESGWINLDGRSHEVRKQGFLSGAWDLIDGSPITWHARKRSAMSRRFDLTGPPGRFVLEAESFACRRLRLRGPDADLVIEPVHPFTRRASIVGRFPDFELVTFAFWLTALTWRRAANNHNVAAG